MAEPVYDLTITNGTLATHETSETVNIGITDGRFAALGDVGADAQRGSAQKCRPHTDGRIFNEAYLTGRKIGGNVLHALMRPRCADDRQMPTGIGPFMAQ